MAGHHGKTASEGPEFIPRSDGKCARPTDADLGEKQSPPPLLRCSSAAAHMRKMNIQQHLLLIVRRRDCRRIRKDGKKAPLLAGKQSSPVEKMLCWGQFNRGVATWWYGEVSIFHHQRDFMH